MNHTTDAEGSQEATEAKPVPSWLTETPCPSWCGWTDDHAEKDLYDDRSHTARPLPPVVMTAMPTSPGNNDPDIVGACLEQHYREIEPRILVECNEQVTGIQLTPAEAEALGDMLFKLAAIARGQGNGAGPVAERSSGPLTATVWTEPGRVDVFRDERRPDWERPLTPAEAEAFGRDLVELAETARGQ